MGIYQCLLVILLVQCVLSAENNRKIDLEDIERDNLVSENQAENGKEHLEKQQTQHFRPPGIQAYNQFKTSSIAALRGGVQYAGVTSRQEDELDKDQNDYTHGVEEDRGHRLSQVHYVPSSNRVSQDYAAPSFHETARANNDPIRPTLLKPVSSPMESYAQRQSEYLFLPERNNPQVTEPRELKHVENAIQYAEPQHVDQAFGYKQEQEEAEDDNQSPQNDEYQQQDQHPGSIMHYLPFITRGPSAEQTYVMMAPVPAGYHQVPIVPSVLTYSHHSQSPAVQYQPQVMQYVGPVAHQQPQINYIDNNEAEGHNPPRRSNDQDIQYAGPNDISPGYNSLEKSKQYVFAPKHPEYEKQFPRVQQLSHENYAVSPVHHPVYSLPRAVQAVQIPSVQGNQILAPVQNYQSIYPAHHHHADLFHGRDTKSLLDSYIPSWIVVQRQKSLQQNYPNPVVNGYNTISYSVPHHLPRNEVGYYDKRSIKSPM